MTNVYVDAINKMTSKKDFHLSSSENKKAWEAQGGDCFFCKKMLNKSYLKYVRVDGVMRVICVDCYFSKGLNK